MEKSSAEKVSEDRFLVANILVRLDSTKSLVRCSAANTFWNEVATIPSVVSRFARRNSPGLLGFLASYEYDWEQEDPRPVTRLLHVAADAGAASTLAIGSRVDHQGVRDESVLFSKAGEILIQPPGERYGFYKTCPTIKPRLHHLQAPCLPHLSEDQGRHCIGQFGVIPSVGMAFFLKAMPPDFTSSFRGISFKEDHDIAIHVCIYADRTWSRYSTPPSPNYPPYWVLNANPMCVLKGDWLMMTYIVGQLAVFQLSTKKFSLVPLPGNLDSCQKYSISSHSHYMLALSCCQLGTITVWLYQQDRNGPFFAPVRCVNLSRALSGFVDGVMLAKMMSRMKNEDLPEDPYYEFCSARILSSSDNGRDVLISLGFDSRLFITDTLLCTARQVETDPEIHLRGDGEIRAILPLSERWPPYVYRLPRN